MDNRLTHIKKAAQQIRLSVSEKDQMRARIYERIGASQRAQAAMKRPSAAGWFVFSMRYSMAFALVLMVFVGSTTTYAAQGALPGAPLYPVKIYVNENIREVFAVSEESRISFHTKVAQERLKEAETLASEGRLNEEAASSIEKSFNTHVAKAETAAAALEEKDPATGVEVRAELDSSLEAHSSILSRIGDSSDDEQTKKSSHSIAEYVRSRGMGSTVAVTMAAPADAAAGSQAQTMAFSMSAPETSEPAPAETSVAQSQGENARVKSTAKNSAASTTASLAASVQKKVALQLQKKATTQWERTKNIFEDIGSFIDASTTAKVEARLILLEGQLDAANTQLEHAEYEAARATFTGVIKGSIELKTLLEASKRYKRDLVRSQKEQDDDKETKRQVGQVAGTETEEENRGKKED